MIHPDSKVTFDLPQDESRVTAAGGETKHHTNKADRKE